MNKTVLKILSISDERDEDLKKDLGAAQEEVARRVAEAGSEMDVNNLSSEHGDDDNERDGGEPGFRW